MRPLIAFFFLSLLLVQSGSRWLVVAGFTLNQGTIARTLCENRTRPQLHCNGRCVLAKRLKAAEERDNQQPSTRQAQVEVHWFVAPVPVVLTFDEPDFSEKNNPCPTYADPVTAPPRFSFFHPPRA